MGQTAELYVTPTNFHIQLVKGHLVPGQLVNPGYATAEDIDGLKTNSTKAGPHQQNFRKYGNERAVHDPDGTEII